MSNRLFRRRFLRYHASPLPAFAAAGAISLAAIMLPASGYGQATTASLGGTVTDPSGAVIPNAKVTLMSTKSKDVRVSKSDGKGVFNFQAIPVGDYRLYVEFPGFNKYEATGIHLGAGDELSLHAIKLVVGSEENVVVSQTTAQIDMDSGELSNTISASDIQHLPVEGRDVTELLKILPGMAINNGTNIENQSYDPSIVNFTGALGAYSGNGTATNATSLLTDGADITDPGSWGIAIQNVNYEQVAEVKVQTSSFTADTARGPIVINTITKSGGDHFHGSLYTYARTYQLNSTDWLANDTGQAKPPDRVVYPGGTLGGPVLIPGTNFNHARKLTFFVGAEDYAQRNIYAYNSASSATVSALVPTVGMHQGDFSQQQIEQYLGPFYQAPATAGASCNISIYNNLCNVPQTGLRVRPWSTATWGPTSIRRRSF